MVKTEEKEEIALIPFYVLHMRTGLKVGGGSFTKQSFCITNFISIFIHSTNTCGVLRMSYALLYSVGDKK